jgi:S-DNA-T family DNA segregation ATPase FtsK/SpoIIIE
VGQATAMPPTVAARCSERWVFHLTDPLDGSTLGVAAATVPADVPGRIVVVGGPAAGLEGQLALPPTPAVHCRLVENVEVLPEPIDCVPAVLDGARLPGGWHADSSTWLPLGPAFATAGLAVLEVPDGEHLMVIGPARSGRSRALARLVIGWRQAHPDGWCAVLTPRRSIDGPTATHRSLAGMLADLATDVAGERSVLLAIDDADVVDDTVGERAGTLAAMAATRRPGLLIAAVGKPDALRQTYGHWTTVVRRSRLGLITSAANDLDGDLLGAALPRRMPVPARPGLVWLVDNGSTRLVQLGLDAPAPSTTDVEPARPLGSRP